MRALVASLLECYLGALDEGGHLPVVLLMALESSIVALPSEFVIPPAADLAHAHGRMSLTGVIVAGTLGSWAGASIVYWASLAWVGVTAGRDPEPLAGSMQRISLWVGGFCAFLGLLYWAFVHRRMRR